MVENQEILAKIKQVLDDQGLDTGNISLSSDFEADLGLDSFDEVQIIMELEKAFGLEISDQDAQLLKTVGDVVKYIENH